MTQHLCGSRSKSNTPTVTVGESWWRREISAFTTYYIFCLEPKWPLFWFLVLGGWPSKIEVIGALGTHICIRNAFWKIGYSPCQLVQDFYQQELIANSRIFLGPSCRRGCLHPHNSEHLASNATWGKCANGSVLNVLETLLYFIAVSTLKICAFIMAISCLKTHIAALHVFKFMTQWPPGYQWPPGDLYFQ